MKDMLLIWEPIRSIFTARLPYKWINCSLVQVSSYQEEEGLHE
jgi:hypothetical protein